MARSELRALADRRHELHRGHASSRPLSPDYELVGLVGEAEFEEAFGFRMDRAERPGGDGRIDFRTPSGTIDVKTARSAFNLLREEGKPHAEILVLASFDDWTESAVLLGWEYDEEMLRCPVRDFGYGIRNHFKHVERLRPMSELRRLLDRQFLLDVERIFL